MKVLEARERIYHTRQNTYLALEFFYRSDFNLIGDGLQYSPNFQALSMIWCDDANIMVGCNVHISISYHWQCMREYAYHLLTRKRRSALSASTYSFTCETSSMLKKEGDDDSRSSLPEIPWNTIGNCFAGRNGDPRNELMMPGSPHCCRSPL